MPLAHPARTANARPCVFCRPLPATTHAAPPPRVRAVFERLAEEGIAVYSGDIVGHGKSDGDRALVESYTDAVSACPPRPATLLCGCPAALSGHGLPPWRSALHIRRDALAQHRSPAAQCPQQRWPSEPCC